MALDELRAKLRESENDVKQAMGQAGTLKSDLEQLRATSTNLTHDYGKLRETSREAREYTTAAMAASKDIEKKLEPLTQLQELSESTAERLASLGTLAAGLGHDIANLALPIRARLDSLLEQSTTPETREEVRPPLATSPRDNGESRKPGSAGGLRGCGWR